MKNVIKFLIIFSVHFFAVLETKKNRSIESNINTDQ